MTRPAYDEEAARLGQIAEGWMNTHLLKKKFKFRWFNEDGESKKTPDFVIFNKGKIIAGIECEMKNICYEKFFKYGLDFIGDKIDRLWDKRIPIYYYLCISDRSRSYYNTMKELKRLGRVIHKDTSRMPNEKFYRVQLDDLKEMRW